MIIWILNYLFIIFEDFKLWVYLSISIDVNFFIYCDNLLVKYNYWVNIIREVFLCMWLINNFGVVIIILDDVWDYVVVVKKGGIFINFFFDY